MFGWLFDDGDDSGCDAHHFDEYVPVDDWRVCLRDSGIRVLDGVAGFILERKYESLCEHEGCRGFNFQWRTVTELFREDLYALGEDAEILRPEEIEDLVEDTIVDMDGGTGGGGGDDDE